MKLKYSKLDILLLNAVSVSRWNKTKTALSAVLTTEEEEQIIKDIKKVLKKKGYKIIKVK